MAVADETTLADRIRAVCTVFGLSADEVERVWADGPVDAGERGPVEE